MTGRKALVPAEDTNMVLDATMPAAKSGLLIAT
jgi:hypothetical protein